MSKVWLFQNSASNIFQVKEHVFTSDPLCISKGSKTKVSFQAAALMDVVFRCVLLELSSYFIMSHRTSFTVTVTTWLWCLNCSVECDLDHFRRRSTLNLTQDNYTNHQTLRTKQNRFKILKFDFHFVWVLKILSASLKTSNFILWRETFSRTNTVVALKLEKVNFYAVEIRNSHFNQVLFCPFPYAIVKPSLLPWL